MHISMAARTAPPQATPGYRGGDCQFQSRCSPWGRALVSPVEIPDLLPLEWCSPPFGVGIHTKVATKGWGKEQQQSDNPNVLPRTSQGGVGGDND